MLATLQSRQSKPDRMLPSTPARFTACPSHVPAHTDRNMGSSARRRCVGTRSESPRRRTGFARAVVAAGPSARAGIRNSRTIAAASVRRAGRRGPGPHAPAGRTRRTVEAALAALVARSAAAWPRWLPARPACGSYSLSHPWEYYCTENARPRRAVAFLFSPLVSGMFEIRAFHENKKGPVLLG